MNLRPFICLTLSIFIFLMMVLFSQQTKANEADFVDSLVVEPVAFENNEQDRLDYLTILCNMKFHAFDRMDFLTQVQINNNEKFVKLDFSKQIRTHSKDKLFRSHLTESVNSGIELYKNEIARAELLALSKGDRYTAIIFSCISDSYTNQSFIR